VREIYIYIYIYMSMILIVFAVLVNKRTHKFLVILEQDYCAKLLTNFVRIG